MEYKLKFENGRSSEIYCESDGKPLQDKINAAEARFGSQVKTINGKEVKEHGLGGFLVGAIIGGIAGNAVSKQGLKKTVKSVADKTKSTVKKAVATVKKKEAPKSKRSNYIPNRLIDSIETTSGKTIENKDIIDGAHTKSNVLVSKKRVDSQPKDIDKSKQLSLQTDYLSARKIKLVNTTYGRKLKGSEILDGAYVKKGVFADGGAIDSFNFKKFKLDELIAILPEDVQFMWMHVEGDENLKNYIRSYGPEYKSVKNTYWTITDFGKFELSKGSENIYLDIMVYKEDIKAPEVPYTISLYTKDNHLGLKNFASMLIQKFKVGGSVKQDYRVQFINPETDALEENIVSAYSMDDAAQKVRKQMNFGSEVRLSVIRTNLGDDKYTLEQDKDGSWQVLDNSKDMYVDRVFDSKSAAESFIKSRNNQRKLLGFESYFENGGKLKWADARKGDSARVVAENKMGMIVKDYGRKFHLKFPDGTEKTYDASELEFYKLGEDEYAKGGGVGNYEMYDEQLYLDSDLKDAILENDTLSTFIKERHFIRDKNGKLFMWIDWMDYDQFDKLANFLGYKYAKGGGVKSGSNTIYKLRAEGLNDFLAFLQKGMYFRVKSFTIEPMGIPDVVVTFETDASLSEIKSKLREVPDSHVMLETVKPVNAYTGDRDKKYAKGGMTEHGLRLGDEIFEDGAKHNYPEEIVVKDEKNKKHFVNLNKGTRGQAFANGGVIGQEITFNHWSGDVKRGTIDDVHSTGEYIVQSGFGSMLVNPDDVISITAPAPEKKFLGIFEDGGDVMKSYPNGYPNLFEDGGGIGTDYVFIGNTMMSGEWKPVYKKNHQYYLKDYNPIKYNFLTDEKGIKNYRIGRSTDTYAKGGTITFSEDDQEGFDYWIEDGNVITNSDGTYSTQDAQYRNKLTLDELKRYFVKEYLPESDYLNPKVESNLLTDEENQTLNEQLESIENLIDYKDINTFTSGGNMYHTMILLNNGHILTINWDSRDVQYSLKTYTSIDQYAYSEDGESDWDKEYYTENSQSRMTNLNDEDLYSFLYRLVD